jgi:hypothetical protein
MGTEINILRKPNHSLTIQKTSKAPQKTPETVKTPKLQKSKSSPKKPNRNKPETAKTVKNLKPGRKPLGALKTCKIST